MKPKSSHIFQKHNLQQSQLDTPAGEIQGAAVSFDPAAVDFPQREGCSSIPEKCIFISTGTSYQNFENYQMMVLLPVRQRQDSEPGTASWCAYKEQKACSA